MAGRAERRGNATGAGQAGSVGGAGEFFHTLTRGRTAGSAGAGAKALEPDADELAAAARARELRAERPEVSTLGIGITLLSSAVMQWLARAKWRTAVALGGRAMEANAFQTTACFWLSIITLAGIGLNAAFG